MTKNDNDAQLSGDYLEARQDVIDDYGDLWRRAIATSGVTDEKAIAYLLQVCAACYLDGVHQGSRLTTDQIANEK